MIGSVSAQANAFAQALEEPIPQEALDADPGQAQLLALAGGLAALPAPELAAEVKTEQRAMLIAAMERMYASDGTADGPTVPEQRRRGAHRGARAPLSRLRPRSRWSRGVAIGGLGVGVAAGAFSGAAAASTDALPGDTLYGLKRGMEDFRLSLADGDSDRGRIYLDQASTRLNEARRLMERGRAGELDDESMGEVRKALNGVRHDAGEGHRLLNEAYRANGKLAPMQALSEFSSKHRTGWSDLRSRLPQQLSDVSADVTQIFDAIEHDVAPLKEVLPAEPETDGAPGSTATDDGAGSSTSPSPSATSSTRGEPGASDQPQPSGSATDDGLLGDGLLGGDDSSSPSTSGSPADTESPEADITLPPLLPGLLPGLGISGEEE